LPLPKDAQDELKYQTLKDRINTRESSTLVVATLTSSTSYFLLERDTSLFSILGILISLLGILYRELTIFTVEMLDYWKLRKIQERLFDKEKIPAWERILPLPRMVLIRMLFYSSLAIWFFPITPIEPASPFWLLLLTFSISWSLVEFIARDP